MPNYSVSVTLHATAEFPDEPADNAEEARKIVQEWADDAASGLNMDTVDIEITVKELKGATSSRSV